MLLSIITHHRNDNYMGDSVWRMGTCFNKWGRCLEALGATDVEIVCCDYGSVIPLQAAVNLEAAAARRTRFVTVPRRTAKALDGDSKYSSVHATNIAARRANGRYFVYFDIDVYTPLPTFATLLDCLRQGRVDTHDLATTFFWASRCHVPKSFNDSKPSIEQIDDHIASGGHAFQRDLVNPHDFMGAACALLVTREMWYAARGVDERLRYWGVSDIDLHRRLCGCYRFGGDLLHHGMAFYHLEHYSPGRNMSVENPRRANDMTNPTQLGANDDNWGLGTVSFPES